MANGNRKKKFRELDAEIGLDIAPADAERITYEAIDDIRKLRRKL